MLGKKGSITLLFDDFKTIEPALKKEFGQKLNELKTSAQNKIQQLKSALDDSSESSSGLDLSLPGEPITRKQASYFINKK